MNSSPTFSAVSSRVVLPEDAGNRVLEPEGIEHTDTGDNDLRNVASAKFCARHSAVNNSQLYRLEVKKLGDRLGLSKCKSRGGKAPVMLYGVPMRMLEALEAKNLGGPNTQVAEVDKIGDLVTLYLKYDTFRSVMSCFDKSKVNFSKKRYWSRTVV